MTTTEIIVESLEKAKQQIIENIDSQGIKASGRTQKSLHVENRGDSIVLVSDGTGAPFSSLQYGRGAGKVPKNFDEILRQWMDDKGIVPDPIPYLTNRKHKYSPLERGYMSFVYLLSKKIKESGTDRHNTPNEAVYSQVITDTVDNLRKTLIFKIKSNFYGTK